MSGSSWQTQLRDAADYAKFGRNELFLNACECLAGDNSNNSEVLAKISALLTKYGFISNAKKYLQYALILEQNNKNFLLSLAHIELQLGNPDHFDAISNSLIELYPKNLHILSSIIHLTEYRENFTNLQRTTLAKKWGDAAIRTAGGPKQRPPFRNDLSHPLRIAYLSADFCQHTVGILIKQVVANQDSKKFMIYAYSSGLVHDWITDEIAKHCQFIDVSAFSDHDLAKQIVLDQIDILIDLSGHTGGSRLSAFAYRPAPLMISMIGYYATTGLDYIDAAVLDSWHITESTKDQYVEGLIQLECGRWCYYPAFPAPLITPPPVIQKGYITFGSFNNTLKYNSSVFQVWADILKAVPNSRLILKWRTFNDSEFRKSTFKTFEMLGIAQDRIELRGPSFHMHMLEEYGDIDIALDPFPFSGGITSCEALYMGVPVITMPQDRVASRQTYAFLSAIRHPELVADNPNTYQKIAIALAMNPKKLSEYRDQLRMKMLHSSLMDIKNFVRSLEHCLLETYAHKKALEY